MFLSRLLLAGIALTVTAAQAAPPRYRDLNHNSRMDPYEDATLTPAQRTDDLVKRMTLAEKAGAMMLIGAESGTSVVFANLLILRRRFTKPGVQIGADLHPP